MPNKKRILLAEDEEHLLEAIKLNLELEGYKVSTATNGKKALQIFKEERFNLVILLKPFALKIPRCLLCSLPLKIPMRIKYRV
jgi:ActR/RegA family two-component response regulator